MATSKRNSFAASRRTERAYERQLRRLARTVGNLIEPFIDGARIPQVDRLTRVLNEYAETIGPWASRVGNDMLQHAQRKEKTAMRGLNKRLTTGVKGTLGDDAVGREHARLLAEQVHYIRSIPRGAATRAQELATEGLIGSRRADDVAADIQNIGHVTESRAVLIARTETAKAHSAFTQARATAVGSDAYIWRTADDADVRESHAEMEGQTVLWSSPPTLSDGTTTHAGQIYNCRCYPEPIFSDLMDDES